MFFPTLCLYLDLSLFLLKYSNGFLYEKREFLWWWGCSSCKSQRVFHQCHLLFRYLRFPCVYPCSGLMTQPLLSCLPLSASYHALLPSRQQFVVQLVQYIFVFVFRVKNRYVNVDDVRFDKFGIESCHNSDHQCWFCMVWHHYCHTTSVYAIISSQINNYLARCQLCQGCTMSPRVQSVQTFL